MYTIEHMNMNMEQPNNSLDFTNGGNTEVNVDALPIEQVANLANMTRVGNIEVGEDFDFEKLEELRDAVEVYKKQGLFGTPEKLADYNGFIRTIETVLLARQKLQEASDVTLH